MSKEIKNQPVKLTDEDTAKASGGVVIMGDGATVTCPACHKQYPLPDIISSPTNPPCPHCGYVGDTSEVW